MEQVHRADLEHLSSELILPPDSYVSPIPHRYYEDGHGKGMEKNPAPIP